MAIINRWYQILQIMDNYQSIKQKELADLLEISRQTLSKNIYLLNNELDQIASISTEDGVYTLDVFDINEYEKILAGKLKRESDFNSTTKRMAYILKRLIGQKEIITIDQLSEEMMVSRGTVSNNISTLRKFISDYEVEIIGKTNNGLVINGEELDIRLIYVNYVMEYFPPELVTDSFKNLLSSYCHKNDIPAHITRLLTSVIEVSILRVRNNQLLKSINPYYENFIKDTEFFEYIHYLIEENFEMSLSATELDFIVYPLSVFNQGSGIKKVYNMNKTRHLFNQIIENVEQVFSISISKDQFFDIIRYHLTHLTNRLVMQLDMNDLFFEEVAEKYPSSYAIAEEASRTIADVVGRDVPKAEINYLTLYFEMELSGNGVPNKRHIAVICHTGMGTALIIKNQLQKVIGHDVHVTAYSQQEVSDETLDKYFAIFTTIPLRTRNTKVPVIQMNSIVNDSFVKEQWRKIEKNSLISDNKLELVISKISANSNYLDLINQMSEELIEANLVDDNFKDSILERENMKSTIFDPTIGMPHALNFKNRKIVLNFGKYDKDTNDIPKFVFLLAIPNNADEEINNLLLDVYDFIFRISSDSNLIKKLSDVDSEDNLRQIIMED